MCITVLSKLRDTKYSSTALESFAFYLEMYGTGFAERTDNAALGSYHREESIAYRTILATENTRRMCYRFEFQILVDELLKNANQKQRQGLIQS